MIETDSDPERPEESLPITKLIKTLENSDDNEEIIHTCKMLFVEMKRGQNRRYLTDIIDCLHTIVNQQVNKEVLEMSFKLYYQVKSMLPHIDHDDNEFEQTRLLKDALSIYAMLTTDFSSIISEKEMFNMCMKSLEDMTKIFTKHLYFGLRNLNRFCKIFSSYPLPNKRIWRLITLNLSAPFSGINEQNMLLFANITRNNEFAHEMFIELTTHWPWTNKHKYYLLAATVKGQRLRDDRLPQEIDSKIVSGLEISLKYRNLLTAGQVLFKALLQIRAYEESLCAAIANIFEKGSNFTLQNCIIYWCGTLKELTHNIYKRLRLDEPLSNLLDHDDFAYLRADNFARFITFRNIFKSSFAKHLDIEQLDKILIEKSMMCDNIANEHLFDIVIDNMMNKSGSHFPAHADFLLVFLVQIMQNECTSFRHNIFKKLPSLFDMLAQKFSNRDFSYRHSIESFFTGLRSKVFLAGLKSDSYQALIFSVKMYEIILKILCSDKNFRLSKKTNPDANRLICSTLKEKNVWHFKSPEHFQLLSGTLVNEYDDIREIGCQLLIDFFEFCPDREDSLVTRCQSLLDSPDINQCLYASNLAKVITSRKSAKNNIKALATLCDRLDKNLLEFRNDALRTARNGGHLFGYLSFLSEIVISFKDQKDIEGLEVELQSLISRAEIIAEFMLAELKTTGTSAKKVPSFEVMEDSLQKTVVNSKWQYDAGTEDKQRKFLLLSIWQSLRGCGELAASIGTILVVNQFDGKQSESDVRRCMDVNVKILMQCRHKGAIESAGVSLGRLVNVITNHKKITTESYQCLFNYFGNILANVHGTSTTRRGAGFSIMLHSLVKCESSTNGRPLLEHAMKLLMRRPPPPSSPIRENCDRLEASTLHCLCVLVKDASLSEEIMPYIVKIMLLAFERIAFKDWTVRNGALQLFGALMPKLVGQRQFFDEESVEWEPTQITFTEINYRMPLVVNFIIEKLKNASDSLTTAILCLELLSGVEMRQFTADNASTAVTLKKVVWSLLGHQCYKIRFLAAKCVSRFHDFLHELPSVVKTLAQLVFEPVTQNLRHGMLLAIRFLLEKYESDIRFIEGCSDIALFDIVKEIIDHRMSQVTFTNTYLVQSFLNELVDYLRCKLAQNIK